MKLKHRTFNVPEGTWPGGVCLDELDEVKADLLVKQDMWSNLGAGDD